MQFPVADVGCLPADVGSCCGGSCPTPWVAEGPGVGGDRFPVIRGLSVPCNGSFDIIAVTSEPPLPPPLGGMEAAPDPLQFPLVGVVGGLPGGLGSSCVGGSCSPWDAEGPSVGGDRFPIVRGLSVPCIGSLDIIAVTSEPPLPPPLGGMEAAPDPLQFPLVGVVEGLPVGVGCSCVGGRCSPWDAEAPSVGGGRFPGINSLTVPSN